MNNRERNQTVQVTPEDLVIDSLIGEHETHCPIQENGFCDTMNLFVS
jgi:hypothetical protein